MGGVGWWGAPAVVGGWCQPKRRHGIETAAVRPLSLAGLPASPRLPATTPPTTRRRKAEDAAEEARLEREQDRMRQQFASDQAKQKAKQAAKEVGGAGRVPPAKAMGGERMLPPARVLIAVRWILHTAIRSGCVDPTCPAPPASTCCHLQAGAAQTLEAGGVTIKFKPPPAGDNVGKQRLAASCNARLLALRVFDVVKLSTRMPRLQGASGSRGRTLAVPTGAAAAQWTRMMWCQALIFG